MVLLSVKDNSRVGESEARGLKEAGKERGWNASRAWPQTIKEKLVFPRQG